MGFRERYLIEVDLPSYQGGPVTNTNLNNMKAAGTTQPPTQQSFAPSEQKELSKPNEATNLQYAGDVMASGGKAADINKATTLKRLADHLTQNN